MSDTYQLTGEGYVIRNGETKVPTMDAPGLGPHPETLAYRAWLAAGGVPLPIDPATAPSQFDKDQARYVKRAAVKDQLIAYMAADNMSRVRAGVWTVPQLMTLMDDPSVASANAYMATLSFELAAQSIASAATPLLTPQIRADWVSKLQAHFYLGG
jgi:hypothetical protein